jgi:hypothetical protein
VKPGEPEREFAATVARALGCKGLEPLRVECNQKGLAIQYRRPSALEIRTVQVDMGKLCNRLGSDLRNLLPAILNEVLEHADQQEEGMAAVPPGGCPWCGLPLDQGETETRLEAQSLVEPAMMIREHVECSRLRERVKQDPPKCEPCGKELEPRPRGKARRQPGVMFCPGCWGAYRV